MTTKPQKEVSIGSTYEILYADPRNGDESLEEVVEGVESVEFNGAVKFYDANGNLLFAMWYPISVKLLDSQRVVH
jgi:hypothetical protein